MYIVVYVYKANSLLSEHTLHQELSASSLKPGCWQGLTDPSLCPPIQ